MLTDTFQLYEPEGKALDNAFPENNARVRRQKQSPIRVVIANPPYSAQQDSANDDNQNLRYPSLDVRIQSTYAGRSSAKLLKNLYDSYIRAMRWASDRIENRGVIGFVTNGSFIDANNMDGLRACLAEEFTSLYVFNLRGNARTQGEQRRMEAGNVFGAGTRTPVAITLLVKNPAKAGERQIHYHDIGDYLSREEKLAAVNRFASVGGLKSVSKWTMLRPNAQHDWTDQRDPAFERFLVLGDKDDASASAVFGTYSMGVLTARDSWVCNMSRTRLRSTVRNLVAAYNAEMQKYQKANRGRPRSQWLTVESFVDMDSKRISWSRALKADVVKGKELKFTDRSIVESMYRPFSKQWLYFDRRLNEMVVRMPNLFPTPAHANIVIALSGVGASKEFSSLVSSSPTNYHMHDTCQCFPLYSYDEVLKEDGELLVPDGDVIGGYRRRSAVTDTILKQFRAAYEPRVSKEDIFFYVYGVLHSQEYRTRFASDLKKMLPRIPLTREAADFWKFSEAGRDLAEWHLNYETIEPFPLSEHCEVLDLDPESLYRVEKMTFGRPSAEQKASGEKWDKTRIIYNGHITLSGIPTAAYEYVVNGKPAIEWIMERYQVTVDKDSGIRNDPNDWSKEHGEPRYIIDLVKRIVRVSLETMKIVNSLPALNER